MMSLRSLKVGDYFFRQNEIVKVLGSSPRHYNFVGGFQVGWSLLIKFFRQFSLRIRLVS